MTLTFFTNLINHHQIPLSDEFYKVLGQDYHYVAMEPMSEEFVKNGYDQTIKRPYIIKMYSGVDERDKALKLIETSDVVIIGHAPDQLFWEREKANKITFHYSERWLKQGIFRVLNPISLFHFYINHIRFRNKRTYMLCASAYTKSDVNKFGAYPKKCFKWGYFTHVNDDEPIPQVRETVKLMWCARMIRWKHPELAVKLACLLKQSGYEFTLDMYGSGDMRDDMSRLISTNNLGGVVRLCGNVPNEEILHQMREHDIFLFTSDKGEGWGAVANEAMSNGCVLVGSNEIGAVPYLVKDDVTGCVFKSGDIDSLFFKVKWLIDNPKERLTIAKKAYATMHDEWSPRVACKRFLHLAEYIINDRLDTYSLSDGPASWA